MTSASPGMDYDLPQYMVKWARSVVEKARRKCNPFTKNTERTSVTLLVKDQVSKEVRPKKHPS